MRETAVLIDGPVGQLEALYLDHPEPRGLALICHPNPVQGGTMLNKVVSTLQRTARDATCARNAQEAGRLSHVSTRT